MTAPAPTTGLTTEQAAAVAAQAAYEAQQQALRQQLAAAVIAMWAPLAQAGLFGPAEAAEWVARVLPIALGAQQAMAALTVAQLNQIHSPPAPIVVSPVQVTGEALRGVSPRRYYTRPVTEARWRLSQGKTFPEAIEAGQRRALSIAQTDVQLAHTHTARQYLREAAQRPPGPRGQVVGYRRVLSSNPNHCALCVLASTQRYHRDDLMPMHPGCGCRVMPIYGTEDPGQVINEQWAADVHRIVRRDLGESYVDPGGRLGDAHYRDIIVTNRHGELGPVLGVRGHHFQRDPNRPGRLTHDRINPEPEDVTDLDAL